MEALLSSLLKRAAADAGISWDREGRISLLGRVCPSVTLDSLFKESAKQEEQEVDQSVGQASNEQEKADQGNPSQSPPDTGSSADKAPEADTAGVSTPRQTVVEAAAPIIGKWQTRYRLRPRLAKNATA